MPRLISRVLAALALLVLPAAPCLAAPPAPPDLDALVARVMQVFEVPGIGLAVVKDGSVVAARGYGARQLGATESVDARTLFGIASNTKAFTALALGLLVEEGRLEWDAPVVRYLPWFQMWDPWVTRELSVRDLLVHRSGLGLGAGDLLWWPPSTYGREQIARRLRFVPPATSFRSAYAYDNVLYLVAGEVIREVTGRSWEDFVTDRVLRPAGMTRSNVLHSAAGVGANTAAPHARVSGAVRPIKPFDSDNTNPAGGINSSAEDMAKWLLVLLAEGRLPDGARLFSERTARELAAMVTPIPITDPPAELLAQKPSFRGYALGLGVQDYRGHKLLSHGGALPGYVSRLALLPDLELGVAVLTNQESNEALGAIMWSVLDHYLGATGTDWVEAYRQVWMREQAETVRAVESAAAARDPSSRPSLPLGRYAGNYADAWYGNVQIALERDSLVMRFVHTPLLVGDLEHWQHDTFMVRWRDRELRADAYASFSLEPDGRIAQLRMRPVSPDTDFSFDFQDLLLRPVDAESPR